VDHTSTLPERFPRFWPPRAGALVQTDGCADENLKNRDRYEHGAALTRASACLPSVVMTERSVGASIAR
jgi:hypothetical protein